MLASCQVIDRVTADMDEQVTVTWSAAGPGLDGWRGELEEIISELAASRRCAG